MKKRDIILDFTSLLDVTLIVIFFFVLFSHLDSEANKAKIEMKERELESAVQQAEVQKAKDKELEIQLEKEISIAKDSGTRQGENANEIVIFNRSDNLKLLLDMEPNSWKVRIIRENKVIDVLSDDELIDEELLKIFENAEYTDESTIFCDFVYDGSKPGTYSAYKRIKKGLNTVVNKYNHLYISETDLSIGE